MVRFKGEREIDDFDAQIKKVTTQFVALAAVREKISENDVIALYGLSRLLFKLLLRNAGFSEKSVGALLTKFNDAGPRSAPWKPTSSRVPGRPQDGKDGNRIQRWLLPTDHKFFSTRTDGTLVAIKYIFQALSMLNAPETPAEISDSIKWLVGHPVRPGQFLDPIQRIPVDLKLFAEDPRLVTSGHIHPLDRGGRHEPRNTSLLLKQSNALQGNNTIAELLEIMKGIIQRHQQK